MLLLPSEDLGSGPRMLKAIRPKGAPTLYSCSLPLVRFLRPLRAAQGSQMRQHFSTSLRTLFQLKRSRTFCLHKTKMTSSWTAIEFFKDR
ncbi:hypothetical protein TNCV_3173111 [Trichonephila clavipes]|nr:hypothetical protein TNCV_3173111 [Trichonephila clavipes]